MEYESVMILTSRGPDKTTQERNLRCPNLDFTKKVTDIQLQFKRGSFVQHSKCNGCITSKSNNGASQSRGHGHLSNFNKKEGGRNFFLGLVELEVPELAARVPP